MAHKFLYLAGALALLCIASCSPGSDARLRLAEPLQPVEAVAPQLSPELPELPAEGEFEMLRLTAATEGSARIAGRDAHDSALAQLGAVSLTLASEPGQLAYGLYRFNAAPGEEISAFGYDGSALSSGGSVWLGLANRERERWEFLPASALASQEITLPAATDVYTSELSGALYLFVGVYGGDSLTVDDVFVQFSGRHRVTGQVSDGQGAPIEGALITSAILGQSALSDSAGNYSLEGMPDGDWPLMATADGWTFYDQPQQVSISGADTAGPDFMGLRHQSRFLPGDPLGDDDRQALAQPLDLLAGPHSDSVSILDDEMDWFRLDISQPGQYLLQLRDSEEQIYFPIIETRGAFGEEYARSHEMVAGWQGCGIIAASAPQTVYVNVSLRGGGGDYTLEMTASEWRSLGGTLNVGADGEVPAAQLLLSSEAQSISGILSTRNSGDLGRYFAGFLPPAEYSLMPQAANHVFVPQEQLVDLNAADQTAVDFDSTYSVVGDSHEPNGTMVEAAANAVLTLPYDSAGSEELQVGSQDDDLLDLYEFTPAAGKGLIIRVECLSERADDETELDVRLFGGSDYASVPLFTSVVGQLTTLRLGEATDGDAYYLQVKQNRNSSRNFAYSLSIDTFDPRMLDLRSEFDGQQAFSGRFMLRTAAVENYEIEARADTPGFVSQAGEELWVEYLRFGFGSHRETRHFSMPDSDHELLFSTTDAESLDSCEPNEAEEGGPFPITLPFSAQMSCGDESLDCFSFTLPDSRPLRVRLVTDSPMMHNDYFYTALTDSLDSLIDENDISPGRDAWFATGAGGDCRLNIQAPGLHSAYSLQIEQVEAYELSGTVLDGGNALSGAVVYCEEAGLAAYPDDLTGEYSFGPLPPGDYTVTAWFGGYSSAPASPSVSIVDQAVVQNFELSAGPADEYEPNDDSGSATLLEIDAELTSLATLGDSDSSDWYRFSLTDGQLCEIYMEWPAGWMTPPRLSSIDTPGSEAPQAVDAVHGANSVRTSFRSQDSGEFRIEIRANGEAAQYRIAVKVH